MFYKAPKILLLIAALAAPMPALAQSNDDPVKEISATAGLIAHLDTIARNSEEIAFWQGVAVLGGAFDWRIDFSADGSETIAPSYRLFNALEESNIETKRAAAALDRSRHLDDETKRAIADISALHSELRDVGETIIRHLENGETKAAAELYWTKGIDLRRALANASYSVKSGLHGAIKTTARAAR